MRKRLGGPVRHFGRSERRRQKQLLLSAQPGNPFAPRSSDQIDNALLLPSLSHQLRSLSLVFRIKLKFIAPAKPDQALSCRLIRKQSLEMNHQLFSVFSSKRDHL